MSNVMRVGTGTKPQWLLSAVATLFAAVLVVGLVVPLLSVGAVPWLTIVLVLTCLIVLEKLRLLTEWMIAAGLASAAVLLALPVSSGPVLLLASGLAYLWAFGTTATQTRVAKALAVAFPIAAAITQTLATGLEDASVLSVFARSLLLSCTVASLAGRRNEVQRDARTMSVIISLMAAVTVISLVAWPQRDLSNRLQANYSTAGGTLREFGWASSPNEMGYVCALLLLATALLFISGSLSPVGALAVSLPMLYVLVATSARTATIALFLGTVVGLLAFASKRFFFVRRRAVVVAVGLGLASVSIAIVGLGGRDVFGRSGDGSAVYRQDVIATVLGRILAGDATIWGAGFSEGSQPRENILTYGFTNVDGSLYYLTASVGVVGLAIFSALVVLAALRLRGGGMVALSFLTVFLFTLGFENSVAWPSSLLLVALIGGLASGTITLSRFE